MSRWMMRGAALGALLVLCGCETVSAVGYRQKMDLLVGTHSDQLMLQWGIPDAVEKSDDGGQVFTFHKVYVRYYTGRAIGEDGGTGVDSYQLDDGKIRYTEYPVTWTVYGPAERGETTCDTRFVIGPDHLVKSIDFVGPNCVAAEKRTPKADS